MSDYFTLEGYSFYGKRLGFKYRHCIPKVFDSCDIQNIIKQLIVCGFACFKIDDYSNDFLHFLINIVKCIDVRVLRDTAVFKFTDILVHSDFAWQIRTNDKLLDFLQLFFNCNELVIKELDNVKLLHNEDRTKVLNPFIDSIDYRMFYVLDSKSMNIFDNVAKQSGLLVWNNMGREINTIGDINSLNEPSLIHVPSSTVIVVNKGCPFQFITNYALNDPQCYLPLQYWENPDDIIPRKFNQLTIKHTSKAFKTFNQSKIGSDIYQLEETLSSILEHLRSCKFNTSDLIVRQDGQ